MKFQSMTTLPTIGLICLLLLVPESVTGEWASLSRWDSCSGTRGSGQWPDYCLVEAKRVKTCDGSDMLTSGLMVSVFDKEIVEDFELAGISAAPAPFTGNPGNVFPPTTSTTIVTSTDDVTDMLTSGLMITGTPDNVFQATTSTTTVTSTDDVIVDGGWSNWSKWSVAASTAGKAIILASGHAATPVLRMAENIAWGRMSRSPIAA